MPGRTLTIITIYALAMALLESAVVVYLRRLYYPEHPLEIFPLQFLGAYDAGVELSREVATIVMLLTVAALAERSSLTRCFAVFVYMFGIWDIFYYVWLKVLMGWPTSWLEWDVLFLIPIVWLGPWICPAMISLLFIAWGWWTLRSSEEISFTAGSLSLFLRRLCVRAACIFSAGCGCSVERRCGPVEPLHAWRLLVVALHPWPNHDGLRAWFDPSRCEKYGSETNFDASAVA
jgi:hypothetical protein